MKSRTVGRWIKTAILLCLIAGFHFGAKADIVINEILYNEDVASGDPMRSQEWVEIFNKGPADEDLTGWTIADRGGREGPGARALPSVVLPVGNYLVVHFSPGTNDLDFSDGAADYFTGDQGTPDIFDSTMDECGLYSSARIVDFFAWNFGESEYEPGAAHDDAVAAAIWTPGSLIDAASFVDFEGQMPVPPPQPGASLGRDRNSTDTNQPPDLGPDGGLDAAVQTPGLRNSSPRYPYIVPAPPPGEKKWTIMLYINGDNSLANYAFGQLQQLERTGASDQNVNVVVLFDTDKDQSLAFIGADHKFHIVPNTKGHAWRFLAVANNSVFVQMGVPPNQDPDRGEVNMSHPDTLRDFVIWARNNYRAKHYALVLWDHGGGWRGFSYDEHIPGDTKEHKKLGMHVGQLRSALTDLPDVWPSPPFEIIGFDSCLMGMIEVAYQVKDLAHYFVASEDVIWSPGWPYDRWLNDLKQNPDWTGKDLAIAAVNDFKSFSERERVRENEKNWTLSCIDETKLGDLNDQLSAYADRLAQTCDDFKGRNNKDDNLQWEIATVLRSVEKFHDRNYIDLYDFLKRICDTNKIPGGNNAGNCTTCYKTGLSDLLELTKPSANGVVIAEAHGSKHDQPGKLGGLSIYLPLRRTTQNAVHPEGLATYGSPYDFPSDTSRETDDTTRRAMYARNDDWLPQKANDIESKKPLPKDAQGKQTWPLVDTPDFLFVTQNHWPLFLNRFYHPVADNYIVKAECPGGNPAVVRAAAGCEGAMGSDEVSITDRCKVFFSGAGSSDADTVPTSNAKPTRWMWDFNADEIECKEKECKAPYKIDETNKANDHVNADRTKDNGTNDEAAKTGEQVDKVFGDPGNYVVTLHVWDDNHESKYPNHSSSPAPPYVHIQSASHTAIVHVKKCADDGTTSDRGPDLRPQSSLEFHWEPLAEAWSYDVMKIDLTRLRTTGGDFTSSVVACLEDDDGDVSFSDVPTPAVGQVVGYVVRAANCVGLPGSYDDAGGQVGSRDAGIDGSSLACTVGPNCDQRPEICDDGDPCTIESCVLGRCEHAVVPDGTSCSDGDVCNGEEMCGFGQCQRAEAISCEDVNACTEDFCDPVTGCYYVATACDDGNPCTDDTCDPATGCSSSPNTVPCDDGDACTTADACGDGACLGGPAIDCDDGDVCTDDSCNDATGCQHVASTCDDGDACTNDSCESGVGCLHANNTYRCDDLDPCTTHDLCSNGECLGGAPRNCDDGNPCTSDACEPYEGCVHSPNSNPCDDGQPCTYDDVCAAGVCGGTTISCTSDPCNTRICNGTSSCTQTPLSGDSCDDGNACTYGDICSTGMCGGTTITCTGDPCIARNCNGTASCTETPLSGNACGDGNLCTYNDTCAAGACVGTSITCTGDQCNSSTCNGTSSCTQTPLTGSACDDGDANTSNDTCQNGICVGLASGPPNDTCDGAIPLPLDTVVIAATGDASDDYHSDPACFTGLGQVPTTSPGRDIVFTFGPVAAGNYSIRIIQQGPNADPTRTQNPTLYMADAAHGCPAPGTVSCLQGANRPQSASLVSQTGSSSNHSEEIPCFHMNAGQVVYVFFDNAVAGAANPGGVASLEATNCDHQESEPNDTPSTANTPGCYLEGTASVGAIAHCKGGTRDGAVCTRSTPLEESFSSAAGYLPGFASHKVCSISGVDCTVNPGSGVSTCPGGPNDLCQQQTDLDCDSRCNAGPNVGLSCTSNGFCNPGSDQGAICEGVCQIEATCVLGSPVPNTDTGVSCTPVCVGGIRDEQFCASSAVAGGAATGLAGCPGNGVCIVSSTTLNTPQCPNGQTCSRAFNEGDTDVYSFGMPAANSKVFATVDSKSANDQDYRMRITTDTKTLQFDDDDGIGRVGANSPVIAGALTDGTQTYIKVSRSSARPSEPYSLRYSVRPPLTDAQLESEAGPTGNDIYYGWPGDVINANAINNTINPAENGYVRGTFGTIGDSDCFKFLVNKGDLMSWWGDGNPTRAAGATSLVNIAWPILYEADSAAITNFFFGMAPGRRNTLASTQADGLNNLSPSVGPAAFLEWRASYTGMLEVCYYDDAFALGLGNPSHPSPWAGSLTVNCGPVQAAGPGTTTADVSVTEAIDPPGPVLTGTFVTYVITVTNNSNQIAQEVHLVDQLDPNVAYAGLTVDDGFDDPNTEETEGNNTACFSVPTPGQNDAPLDCINTSMAPGTTTTYRIKVHVANCIGAGVTITNHVDIDTISTDTGMSNNSADVSFVTTENGTCNDLSCDPQVGYAGTCIYDRCTGDPQTGEGVCNAGACDALPVDCDDANVCTTDSCDPATGCINDSSQIGDGCDDFNPCTLNFCDPVVFCVFPPAPTSTACDDFSLCTTAEHCDGQGTCVGRSVCDDGNACTDDFADESNFCACSHTAKSPGTPCDDGNACTVGDACASGACAGSPVPTLALHVSKPSLSGTEPDSNATVSWPSLGTADVIRGDLVSLRSSAGIANVDQCLSNDFAGTSAADNGLPPLDAAYYLVRSVATGCSQSDSYREGVSSEKSGAGGDRDADIAADPDACP